eukprot:3730325-Pyramimonas_sp.AAC.1
MPKDMGCPIEYAQEYGMPIDMPKNIGAPKGALSGNVPIRRMPLGGVHAWYPIREPRRAPSQGTFPSGGCNWAAACPFR